MVVNLGLIDTPEKAFDAGHAFRQADVDLIFLHVTTYALSSTVLPVVRRARVPVIILNLQPGPAIDYASFNRLGDRTQDDRRVAGLLLGMPRSRDRQRLQPGEHSVPPGHRHARRRSRRAGTRLPSGSSAARVAHVLEHNRLGVMGHYYGGMLDIYSDLTQQLCPLRRPCRDRRGRRAGRPADRGGRAAGPTSAWRSSTRPSTSRPTARRPSSSARREPRWPWTGSSRIIAWVRWRITTWAWATSSNEDAISSIILGTSLLTARGIPVAGEMEIKNVQAMKILDSFGAGGSFTEYYAMDYRDDIVLMGHDGPGHIAIAEGKTKVRPLQVYHGKVGRGLSVEMSVRHGPVTLLSVVQTVDGRLELQVAEGESVSGPILEIGNTNSRYRFPWARGGSSRNGTGTARRTTAPWASDTWPKIEKLGSLLGMRVTRVC